MNQVITTSVAALSIIQDDSDTKVLLGELDKEWQALVTEAVTEDGKLEGTILYVPGVSFKQLRA